MSRLERRNATSERTGEIVDAEFVDVDEHHNRSSNGPPSPPPTPPPGWWQDKGFDEKLIFVAVPLLLLTMCTITLSNGSTSGDNATDQPAEINAGRNGTEFALNKEWLTGSWVMTPKGGKDGQTSCGDFNAPALYKLNKKTAKLLSFGADGNYRSLFAYTAPGGNENTMTEVATWSIDGNAIRYENSAMANGPFGGAGTKDPDTAVSADSANVLKIGEDRYVRCVGDVDDILGPPPVADQSQTAEKGAAPAAEKPNLASLCSNQSLINDLQKPFKDAVRQALALNTFNTAGMGLDEKALRLLMTEQQLANSTIRYSFLRIQNDGVEVSPGNIITVRCHAKLRLTQPLGPDAAFSSYVQFNDASWAIRIRNVETGDPETALLAEIKPKDGKWDIVAGTE